MAEIVLRAGKGSPLTNAEVDANFTNLNTAVIDAAATATWAGVTGKPATLAGFGITDAQPLLVSGTSIKTVNGQSVLGSGNIQIDGGVTSFNTRTGAVTLGSGDVTTALGYTPANKAGDTFTGNVFVNAGVDSRFLVQSSGVTQGQLQATATVVRLSSNNALPLALSSNGVDRVTIDGNGNITYGGVALSGVHKFQGTNTGDLVVFESTDPSATAAPDVVLYRNSASPAAADQIGNLLFRGKDSAGNDQNYARILSTIIDPTSGAEVGDLRFGVQTTSGFFDLMTLASAGLSVTGSITATSFSGSASGLTGLKTVNGNSILGSGNIQIDGGVTSFNTRTGAVTLSSGDVTTALGFTPYNATNPSGYITSSALSSYLPLSGGDMTGRIRMGTFANSQNNTGEAWIGRASDRSTGTMTVQLGNSADRVFEVVDSPWSTVIFAAGMNSFTYKGSAILHAGNVSSYAAPVSHTHSYLSLSGGTLTGSLILPANYDLSWGGSYSTGKATLSAGAGGIYLYATGNSSGNTFSFTPSANNSVVALQQGGNQVLHAGNYTSYSPSLSGNYKNIGVGGLYSRYNYNESAWITDSTSAYTLSPDYGTTTVAMHNGHGHFGDWATTLTMSGYERYGAYQISGWYNATTPQLAIRNYNQSLAGWTSWTRLLSAANFSSYALPLSGGTLTGGRPIEINTSGGGVFIRGSAGGWATGLYFRGSDNAVKAAFGSLGGDSSLSYLWAGPEYNNTWMTWSSSAVNSQVALQQGGNQVLHAGNYTSYSPSLTGSGASGTWGIGITGAVNGIAINQERATNTRIYSASAGAMGLLGTDSTGAFRFQLYGSGGTAYGFLDSTWGNWDMQKAVNGELDLRVSATTRRVLHAANFSSYALPLSGGSISGNLAIRSTGPTIFMRDTDNNSAMLHCNSNLMYILRGGVDTESWTQVGGYWPVYWDLTNNNATFGGSIWAAGNITAYSDESVKENWKDLDEDFVERLAEVKSGTFDRTDIKKRQAGVSAQSMQKLLPEVVDYHEKEKLLSVAYGNAALASAVELAKRVVEQDKRIARLEALVEKLIGD